MMLSKVIGMLNTIVTKGLETFGLYYSYYGGIVIEVEDPKGLGRIKLKCPQVYANQVYPEWIKPKSAYSGKGYGMKLVPEIGDTITVEFMYGDPRRPRWSYGYFAEVGDDAENEIEDEDLRRPKNHWLRTPTGLMVQMDDENKSLHIKHPEGFEMRINEETFDIVAPDGKLINMGSFDEAAEFAMLGDTFVEKMETYYDHLAALTVPTAFGPSGTPINAVDFLDDKAQLELYLSVKNKLD